MEVELSTPLGCLFLALSLINTRGSRARSEGGAEGKRVLSTWRGKAGLCDVWGSQRQEPWWEMWRVRNRTGDPEWLPPPQPGLLQSQSWLRRTRFSLGTAFLQHFYVYLPAFPIIQAASVKTVVLFHLALPLCLFQ